MIMRRTRGSLDGHVRAEVHVVLEGVRNVMVNNCTGQRIAILVSSGTLRWEKADVMTLLGNDDCHLDLFITLEMTPKICGHGSSTLLSG